MGGRAIGLNQAPADPPTARQGGGRARPRGVCRWISLLPRRLGARAIEEGSEVAR